MDEQILAELKAALSSKTATEEAVANLSKVINDQVLKASEKYVQDVAEKEAAKAAAEKEAAELKASQEKTIAELAETKQRLLELEKKAKDETLANLFSARMDEMNQEFDLDDEDRKALAEDIRNLDEKPETFAAYKGKMNTFMKDKSKKAKQAKEKEAQAALDKALADKLAEIVKNPSTELEKQALAKILENAKASNPFIPNSNASQSDLESLREKWKNAISPESIQVTYK